MFVSKRTLFFKSERNGYLLFSGNSNSLYQIEDELVPAIQRMIEKGDTSQLPEDVEKEFRKSGIILFEDDEEFLHRMYLKSMIARFRKGDLTLTIAPTLACNFKCTYCYEGERAQGGNMDDNVIKGLVNFAKKGEYKKVHIVWYGGEPLLAFDIIKKINDEFDKEGIELAPQSAVTNGSLLTTDILQYAIDRKFSYMQITIDGDEVTHNAHRPMKNGENSYQTILHKLDNAYEYLKTTNQSFLFSIRVNVDENTCDLYPDVVKTLKSRYSSMVSCYPAFIEKPNDAECHHDNCMVSADQAGFILKLARERGIQLTQTYPLSNRLLNCAALKLDNFVISPTGDMYKCWEDIGILDYSVGNVTSSSYDKNNTTFKYLLTASGYENEECRKCLFLFSCAGGCPKKRLTNLQKKIVLNPVCSVIKNAPEQFIESYFELKNRAAL
ncbi:MAG: SPASM domain-containing protein [Treponema sp.]|nr:SPASM domain-containing protein [Candidatus Treponema caballi]